MLKYLNSQHISTIKISASAIHFFITVFSQKKLFQNFLIQNILSLKKLIYKKNSQNRKFTNLRLFKKTQ